MRTKLRSPARTIYSSSTLLPMFNPEIFLHSGKEPQSPWALNPESVTWSNDKTKLFTSAADTGRQRTFQISIPSNDSTNENNVPRPIDVGNGLVTSSFRYSTSPSDNRLLVSRSSFVDSSSFLGGRSFHSLLQPPIYPARLREDGH